MTGRLKRNIFFPALVLFFFLAGVNVYSFSLSVDDSGGSFFSVTARDDISGEEFALWDDDANSSSWILNINGNLITPSEKGWKREYRNSESAEMLTYSDRLYTFETKINISENGKFLLITASFINNSNEKVDVAPFMLLDTSLGESTGLPLKLPDGSFVTGELYLETPDIPAWIGSIRSKDVPSLYIFPVNDLSEDPYSMIVANWLRLKQSGPEYEYEEGRSFDNLPFSAADSAVMIRYKVKNLDPGERRVVKIIMGLQADPPDSEVFDIGGTAARNLESERFRLREYTLIQRLRAVQTVLDELDYLLDNDGDISDEAVSNLENSTSDQEKLRREYENL